MEHLFVGVNNYMTSLCLKYGQVQKPLIVFNEYDIKDLNKEGIKIKVNSNV
jgi:hypothetical protein